MKKVFNKEFQHSTLYYLDSNMWINIYENCMCYSNNSRRYNNKIWLDVRSMSAEINRVNGVLIAFTYNQIRDTIRNEYNGGDTIVDELSSYI